MAEAEITRAHPEKFHQDRLLELAEPVNMDTIIFEPASDWIALIVSRILFAMGQKIHRLAIPLGENFAAVLNEMSGCVLPPASYDTGYAILYDQATKTLLCERME